MERRRYSRMLAGSTGVVVFLLFMITLDLVPGLGTWVRTDREVHRWFFEERTAWLIDVCRGFSDVIDWQGAPLLVLAVSIAAFRFGERREAVFMALAAASAYLFSTLAKELIGRVRPDSKYQAVLIDSPSFPSGHALHSIVFYGAAALLVHRWVGHRFGAAFVAVVAVLAVVTGAARVYLGVHWPSDVLAGWVLGVLWLAICWSLFRMWELRPERTTMHENLAQSE
jgi:membrane-associated phospholipid phosphatase